VVKEGMRRRDMEGSRCMRLGLCLISIGGRFMRPRVIRREGSKGVVRRGGGWERVTEDEEVRGRKRARERVRSLVICISACIFYSSST